METEKVVGQPGVLTSLAATLFDPFGIRDVVMTSFAVEICSERETDQYGLSMKTTPHDDNNKKQAAMGQFRGGHEYLLTSLASLAIKNPKVPSCIFTWFPGLIRILFNEKEMIVPVNRNFIQKLNIFN